MTPPSVRVSREHCDTVSRGAGRGGCPPGIPSSNKQDLWRSAVNAAVSLRYDVHSFPAMAAGVVSILLTLIDKAYCGSAVELAKVAQVDSCFTAGPSHSY